MKQQDQFGNWNPDYLRASQRADSLIAEALMLQRKGFFAKALARLEDAHRWLHDLAEPDITAKETP